METFPKNCSFEPCTTFASFVRGRRRAAFCRSRHAIIMQDTMEKWKAYFKLWKKDEAVSKFEKFVQRQPTCVQVTTHQQSTHGPWQHGSFHLRRAASHVRSRHGSSWCPLQFDEKLQYYSRKGSELDLMPQVR